MPSPETPAYPTGALLARAHSWFVRECEHRLAAEGYPDLLLAHGINVLQHLTPGTPVAVAELVAASDVTKQAISQQIAYLVEHDYIVAAPSASDRRARTVTLTERGASSQRAIRQIFAGLEREIDEILGADATVLRRALQVLGSQPAPS